MSARAAKGTSASRDTSDKRQRIADTVEHIAALQRERSALEEIEVMLRSDERRLLQRTVRVEDECDSLEARIEANESRREQASAALAEAQAELAELDQIVATLERGVERLELEAHELEHDRAELTWSIARAQQRVQAEVGSVLRLDHKLRGLGED